MTEQQKPSQDIAPNTTIMGPAKGGFRYHPDVCLDEVKGLSMWMTFNVPLWNPYGGAKGGFAAILRIYPKENLKD